MNEPVTLTGREKEREELQRREQRAIAAHDHLLAENERLRAALEKLADSVVDGEH